MTEIERETAGLVRHSFRCGSEAFTWVVPPKWTVRSARVAVDGVTLIDAADHPLHLVTHSAPFAGRVSRETLLSHLHTDALRPDVIPYVYRFYVSTWGFCVPHSWLPRFSAPAYDVAVDTELATDGHLTVGEVVLPGRSPRALLLSAHLDHPGQFEDGLSGAVGLIELIARRRRRESAFFTLRFLFTCETLGALCYLSRFEAQTRATVEGCIAPEALCNAAPLRFGHSFSGDTQLDRAARCVFRERHPNGDGLKFLDLLANDDQVFDGPDMFIPSLSIARAPYPEYHSNLDGLNLFDSARLKESVDTIDEILALLDRNVAPRPLYRSLPFFSRYGIWPDWFNDGDLRKRLEVFLRLLNGRRSVVDLAHESGLPISRTEHLLGLMADAGLVRLDGDPVPIRG
jgi:aminopeptidase-like protein